MEHQTNRELTYHVDGQIVRGYLALPQGGAGPGVIVLHAWWGLTPFFKHLCDRLALTGFVAFAPDLNDGRIAGTIEEAQQIMSERNDELTQAIVENAVEQLRMHAVVEGHKVGVVGFSMGAAWAAYLASYSPETSAAVVLFYGITDGIDFANAKASFLGHFAEQDDWEPIEGVRQMESDIRAAGRDVQFYVYPDATHWFFEQDRQAAYHAEAAELAWTRTIKFFTDHLR